LICVEPADFTVFSKGRHAFVDFSKALVDRIFQVFGAGKVSGNHGDVVGGAHGFSRKGDFFLKTAPRQ